MDISQIVLEAGNLPATPQILPRLQTLLRREDSTVEDLADLFAADVSLTTELLKVANSVLYNQGLPVDTLGGAISRIGMKETYRVATYICSSALAAGGLQVYGLKEKQFLQHSVAVAALNLSLSEVLGRDDADIQYSVGMLHGVGKVVINRFYIARGIDLSDYAAVGTDQQTIDTMVHAFLGFTHAEVAGKVLSGWNFPSHVVIAVAKQLDSLDESGPLNAEALLRTSLTYAPYLAALNRDLDFAEELKANGVDPYLKDILVPALAKARTRFERMQQFWRS